MRGGKSERGERVGGVRGGRSEKGGGVRGVRSERGRYIQYRPRSIVLVT